MVFFWGLFHDGWDVVEIDWRIGYTKPISIDVFSSGSGFQFSTDESLFVLSFKVIDISLYDEEAKVCCVHSIDCVELFELVLWFFAFLELHRLKVDDNVNRLFLLFSIDCQKHFGLNLFVKVEGEFLSMRPVFYDVSVIRPISFHVESASVKCTLEIPWFIFIKTF